MKVQTLHAITGHITPWMQRSQLNITLGWMRSYDLSIAGWNGLLQAAEASLSYLRREGYHARAAEELAPLLTPLAKVPPAERLAKSVLAFVAAESGQTAYGGHLPASSEMLESLIGRGKRLEGQQSRSGFTKMVLGMAAAVTKPTQDLIQKAFHKVKTTDVLQWAHDKLGISLQSQRRSAFKSPEYGTELA